MTTRDTVAIETSALLATSRIVVMCQKLLPARHLRINRREIKQVYRKYKPKKRGMPSPEPFQAHERFEDCVVIEVRYPLPTSKEGALLALK